MLRITNISITEKASIALDVLKATFQPLPGEIFALYFFGSYRDVHGTTVKGFRPGYGAGSWAYCDSGQWALAHFPSGMEFYFMPKFVWTAQENYLVDMASELFALFSIGPVTQGTNIRS